MFQTRDKYSMARCLSRSLQMQPKLSLRPEYSKAFNAPNTINFIRVPLEEYNETIFQVNILCSIVIFGYDYDKVN